VKVIAGARVVGKAKFLFDERACSPPTAAFASGDPTPQ